MDKAVQAAKENGYLVQGFEIKPCIWKGNPPGSAGDILQQTDVLRVSSASDTDEYGNGTVSTLIVGVETGGNRRPYIRWLAVEEATVWGASHNAQGGWEVDTYLLLDPQEVKRAITPDLLERVQLL